MIKIKDEHLKYLQVTNRSQVIIKMFKKDHKNY